MKNRYITYITYVALVATFFVPLVVIPDKFIFPFIVPKVLLFRALVLVMCAGYAAMLIAAWKQHRPVLTAITLAVFLWLASFTISTFVGVDWYRSFWDNHERMLGLFTIVHYVLYYLILTSMFRKEVEWKWFMRLFAVAASVVMVLALMQKISPEFLLNKGNERVSATLGNAIYLGAYGMFLFFLAALLFMRETSRQWKWGVVVMGILGVIGVFISGTRGALLGFVAGVGVLWILYMILLQKGSRLKRVLVGGFVISIVCVSLIGIFRETTFVQQIPTIGRLVNTGVTGTATTRIMAWGIAVESFVEKPIFGWGPSNFFYAFNKYYRPEFLRFGFVETWFDNAHSGFFNTLAVQGVLGIISYMGLFLVPIVVLFRRFRDKLVDTPVFTIGVAFLVAHFVQQFFVFENPTSFLYFFFWLAFLNVVTQKKPASVDEPVRVSPAVAAGVFLIAVGVIFITNVQPARANNSALQTLISLIRNDKPIETLDRTLTIATPHVDDVRNDFARGTGDALQRLRQAGTIGNGIELYTRASLELDKNLLLHPDDIRIMIQKINLAQAIAVLSQNPTYIIEAKAYIDRAIELSPNRQQLYYNLSGILFQSGRPREAIDALAKTIADDPTIGEGWWRTAIIYQNIGETENARQTVEQAEAENVKFDQQGKQFIKALKEEFALIDEQGVGSAPAIE